MAKELDKSLLTIGEKKYLIEPLMRHAAAAPRIEIKASEINHHPDASHQVVWPAGFEPTGIDPRLIALYKHGDKYIVLHGKIGEGVVVVKGHLVTKHTLKRSEFVPPEVIAQSERQFREAQDAAFQERPAYGSYRQDRPAYNDRPRNPVLTPSAGQGSNMQSFGRPPRPNTQKT